MKNSKFLLALALPAVFAACSNEEIATKAPNADTEVVGANLVSEGLTINVNKNGVVDSRLDANGWSASDKLGLGWVNAATNIYSDQASGTKTNDVKVYANHMFQKNENGLFTTFGNVYEGWHFAYYAYQYMPQVGQMEIVVNPEQKDAYLTEHGSNTFHISAQDYIKAANVDVNTKELKDKVFEVVPAVNELAYRIIPSEQFTNDDVLKSLNIKSIALTTSTGKTPFYSTVTLAPRLLPTIVYDKNDAYDAEETLEKMTVANLYGKKAIVRGEGAKTLTTKVTGEEYDLSGTQTLRMFNTPVQAADLTTTADASKYSVKVTVSAGYFTVKYTKNAEEGSIQESNNNALEEIAGLLSAEGYGDDEINFAELVERQGVTLKLDASMFTADYSKITCKEDWEDCVALADALGEEGPVKFNVTGEVKFDEGEIPMPSCDVLVSTSSKGALVIENAVTWPADLTKNEDKALVITVAEDGILNVNSEVDATSFVNNGLINAGPLASICTEENQVFVNNNRVIVEYGAYVYPAQGNEGVIAFEVEDATQATIGKINVLIKENDLVEYANVNTLIVSTDLSLNALASSIGASSDRYTGSSNASSVELSSLENITVELVDGATLSSTGDVTESVGNIIVKGQSEIVDIKTINGNLTVEEDAELTVSSSYESALDKTVLDVTADVVNQGTLNADTYIVCANIDNKIGTTNVAEGYAIVYNDRYYQGGTANGTIAKPDAWLIEAIETGEEFKMICNVTLSSQLVVNGDVTMNLNGKTIKNTANLWNEEDDSWSLISVQSGSLTIKGNGNFTAKKNDCYAVDVRNGATLNIAGGTYNGNISAVYVLEGTANISGGTFKIQQLAVEGDERFTLNCLDENYKKKTAKIVVTGGTYANFNPANNLAEGTNTNFVKSGYKSTADGANYKVTKK